MRSILGLTDRTIEVAELGTRGWYRDHATTSMTCGCGVAEPDKDCPRGVALFRLATRDQDLEQVHQETFLREMLAPPHSRAPR